MFPEQEHTQAKTAFFYQTEAKLSSVYSCCKDNNRIHCSRFGEKQYADKAFYGNTRIIELNTGKNTKTIGKNAFGNMSALTTLTMENSVESLGEMAFYCRQLAQLK